MATKSKTVKTVEKTQETKLQIPSAVRTGSAADALSALIGSSKKKADSPKKANDRPVLKISEGVLEQWALCTSLADLFQTQAENAKATYKDEAYAGFLDLMWEIKGQPKNPVAFSQKDGKPDCEGQFVVQERFSVGASSHEELVGLLVDQELKIEDAEKLVEEEVSFQPSIEMNLSNLLLGHYEGKEFIPATDAEKAVGQKITALIMENLTDEERELAINQKPKVSVKSGFFSRVVSHCHSKEQLEGVFRVISPVKVARGDKFGISDSPDLKSKRLLAKASEVLGVNLAEDKDADE